MRVSKSRFTASLGLLALVVATALPASADDLAKRFTVELSPNLQFTGTGDGAAPAPPGSTLVGKTNDHPYANSSQLNYGLDVEVTKRDRLYYTHDLIAFNIGRVLTIAPKTAFDFGTLDDRIDTVGFNHEFGHGLEGHAFFYNHARMDVTAFCNEQTDCTNKSGGQSPNPAAIDEHGYGVGAKYAFGPKTRIGRLFTAALDAKYVPRPNFAPPGAPCGACNGLGHYAGSQIIVPYSLQVKLPLSPTPTFIPFVAVGRDVTMYRDEASAEMYNTSTFGFVKVFDKYLALTAVDINYQECRCSDTVPPPDNVRLSEVQLKLTYKTQL